MRILEILLVGIISIQIAILLFRLFKSEKQRFLYLGLGTMVLVLHLVFEGYRWQMIPAYLLFVVILFILLRDRKPKRYAKFVRNTLLIFLIILSILLPSVLPVLHFKTSGEYKVGVKNFQLIDNDRKEILSENQNDQREVSLRVFYPTPSNKKGSYPYMPEYEKMKHTFKKKLGWPIVLLEYLKLFKLDAQENAAIYEDKKFPVIFYSHGMANNFTEAQGRLLKLASHGYTVVAINHTYSSDFAILSNGDVVGYNAQTYLGDPIEMIDSIKSVIANQWIDDVKFAKTEIAKTQLSKSTDLNTIGLLGFSAGGTMATLGSYDIVNVKAVINLDGTPRGIDLNQEPKTPHLFMYSEPQEFSDAQIEAWGITREAIEAPKQLLKQRSEAIVAKAPGDSEIIYIPLTKHSNFIEYPLISPLSSVLEIGGKIDSWQCYEFINEKILKFFKEHLKNNE